MSPEQLSKLQKLSKLFEEGIAGPDQIKQLSELLAIINHRSEINESTEIDIFSDIIS
jgi:predicted ATPase